MTPLEYKDHIEKHGRDAVFTHNGNDYTIKVKIPAKRMPTAEEQVTGGIPKDKSVAIMSKLNLESAGMADDPQEGDDLEVDSIVHNLETVDFAYDGETLYGYRAIISG